MVDCANLLFFSLPNKFGSFSKLEKNSITLLLSNNFLFKANWVIDKNVTKFFCILLTLFYKYYLKSSLFFLFTYMS